MIKGGICAKKLGKPNNNILTQGQVPTQFKCYYTNAGSMVHELGEFEKVFYDMQQLCTGITEAWTNENVPDALLY